MRPHEDPEVARLHHELAATLSRFGAAIDRLAAHADAGRLALPPPAVAITGTRGARGPAVD